MLKEDTTHTGSTRKFLMKKSLHLLKILLLYVPSDPYPNDPGDFTSDCIFDVRSFEAVGDGSADDTQGFRSAWKAACAVESGVILAPADYSFKITSTIFSGPCKPGLVDGTLMAPDGPDSWPEADSRNHWLVFYRLDQMTLNGDWNYRRQRGTMVGPPLQTSQESRWRNGEGPCNSPTMIQFYMSSNVEVSGPRIQNSPEFHMKFDGCEGVLINKLSISSPKLSPNTDGIHLGNSKSVAIYNSMISNGKG